MNNKEIAEILDGIEYGKFPNDGSDSHKKIIKHNKIAVYGYSDDTVILNGVFYDEVAAFLGTTIKIDKYGVLKNECTEDDCPYFAQKLKDCVNGIEAIWGKDEYAWVFETKIPHETFDMMEDGEKFCRGIVFDINDLED